MFGINNGFDIVIGNPPFLRIQGIRESNPKFADYLSKFMQTNKDLGIEKIDSSIENNEFDVTFRVEK
jgi:hypothetical protein